MTEFHHQREFCQVPDIPRDTPRYIAEKAEIHCRCCGNQMRVCGLGGSLDETGAYEVLCDFCPGNLRSLEEQVREAAR